MSDEQELDRVLMLEKEAQMAGERRFSACMEELYDETEEIQETVASAPFCGCHTCIVREIIDAAWPSLYQIAHSYLVEDPSGGR